LLFVIFVIFPTTNIKAPVSSFCLCYEDEELKHPGLVELLY